MTNFLEDRKEEVADSLVTYIDLSAMMLLSPHLDVFVYLFLVTILETVGVAMFLLDAVY